MRARVDEHLGGGGVFAGASRAPRSAVHEHLDMGSPVGGVDVELLVLARTVGEAARLAQASARRLGSQGAAFEELVTVGRVDRLVVGVVERFLIVVAKNRPHSTPLLVKVVEVALQPRSRGRTIPTWSWRLFGGRHGQGWKELSALRGRDRTCCRRAGRDA